MLLIEGFEDILNINTYIRSARTFVLRILSYTCDNTHEPHYTFLVMLSIPLAIIILKMYPMIINESLELMKV